MNKEQETVKKFAEKILDCIHYETFRKGYELKTIERKIKEIAKDYFDVDIVTEQVIIPHD